MMTTLTECRCSQPSRAFLGFSQPHSNICLHLPMASFPLFLCLCVFTWPYKDTRHLIDIHKSFISK